MCTVLAVMNYVPEQLMNKNGKSSTWIRAISVFVCIGAADAGMWN